MVVGNTGSGKTVCWKTLQRALTKLFNDKVEPFRAVHEYVLNPKAITNDELFGNYDKGREWKNGVLSVCMKEAAVDSSPDLKWIVCDGPVDTLWIESMNTVLDDNKILTLISGERISLTEQMSLLFEVQDLAVASPATVSRCGMVFFDDTDLGWKPFTKTWLQQRLAFERETMKFSQPETVVNLLESLIEKFVERTLTTKKECKEIIPAANALTDIRAMCNLFDSIANAEYGLDSKEEPDAYLDLVQKFFIFSMIWSIGGTIDEESRKKLDMLFRELEPSFPSKDTVYEYYIEPKSRTWKSWDEKVNQNWKPADEIPMYKQLVPTVDTVRNSFVINALVKSKKNVLVTGNIGTGKTVIVENVTAQFDESKYAKHVINFSARTSSKKLQDIIESKVEKKSMDTYAPPAGKSLILFIDDFNMPMKEFFGAQPPLELIRQWMDYGFWYDREKQTKKNIKNMQLIAAMGPPGGGRTSISQRLQSRFNVINITFPSDGQVKRIFGTLLNHRLQKFDELKGQVELITQSTIDIYKKVISSLLPIPSKSHYIFNLRDLAKVFMGIIRADHELMDNKEQCYRLWVHECYRVFYDRLNDPADRSWFQKEVAEKLSNVFQVKWSTLFPQSTAQGTEEPKPTLFGEIMTDGSYVEMPDMDRLKTRLKDFLDDYNEDTMNRPMNLVLFNYAVEHIARINRIIRQPRGNALLVGVGGSGRQSLTRLASFIAGYTVFTIEITNNFKLRDFYDKLKVLFMDAGLKKKETVFIFSDTQISDEGFLEGKRSRTCFLVFLN
jgi:dynein heavy chain